MAESEPLAELLTRLGVKTDKLASMFQSRGDTIATKIKAVNDAWANLAGFAVTERRESARAAGAQFDALIAQDDGEIAALEVEIAYIRDIIDAKKAGLIP